MSNPAGLSYTSDHEWLEVDGTSARVGITSFAADALGDVVFVELPEVGSALEAGAACGEIESVKSVSDIYAPANGRVLEVNQAVVDDPSLINTAAFGDGWLFVMSVTEAPDLLTAAEYDELVAGA